MSYERPFPLVNLKSDKEVHIRNYKTEDVGSFDEVVKNPSPSNLRTQMKQQHIIHLHFMF